jgi:hypothetical protein
MIAALGLVAGGVAVLCGLAALRRIVELARQPEHPREAWVRHVRRQLRDLGELPDDPTIHVVRLRAGFAVCRSGDGLYDLVKNNELDEELRRHWGHRWSLAMAELDQQPTVYLERT